MVKKIKENNPFNLSQVMYMQKVLGEMFTDLDRSYIGIMCGGKSRTIKARDFLKKEYWYRKNSCYITGNIIMPDKRRCQKNVCVLNDVYIDLDTNHDDNTRFTSPIQAYEELNDVIRDKRIPYPSMIVNTTRGLQLHWFLSCVSADKARVALWKKIENELCIKFTDFYPDLAVANDESRLLRMPYSINTKTGCMTEILEFNGERYSLRDLKIALFGNAPTKAQLDYIARIEQEQGVIFPEKYKNSKENASTTIKLNKSDADCNNGPVSEKQEELIGKICRTLGIKHPHSRTYHTANKFIRKHLQAYRTVCTGKSRNEKEKTNIKILEQFVHEHPYNDHCRETLLFLYRLSQMHILGDENKAWEKTIQLNRSYNHPFNERKLKKLTNSAVNYFIYEPDRWYDKNAIIIKVGEVISSYFTGPCKRKRDKEKQKEYNSRYYRQKREKENKESKSQIIAKRREQVRKLLADGSDYGTISKELGVCTKTIQRDVENIRKADSRIKTDIFSSTPLLYNTVGIQKTNPVSKSDRAITAESSISSTAPVISSGTGSQERTGLGEILYARGSLIGAFNIACNKIRNCSDFTESHYRIFSDGIARLIYSSDRVDVYNRKLPLDEMNGWCRSSSVSRVGQMLMFLSMQNFRNFRYLVFVILLWLREDSTLDEVYLIFTDTLESAMEKAEREGGLSYY